MSQSVENPDGNLDLIAKYVFASEGLELKWLDQESFQIRQSVDGKSLKLVGREIEEVLSRNDTDGSSFLQVNFITGKKILLTQRLVGFKPSQAMGLDMDKLPKVVTTPDLVSVVEAIEESMHNENTHPQEIEVLKRVYDAVLDGGEQVGFNLKSERAWLDRIAKTSLKPSA